MTRENTEQTPGENIEVNKKNLARPRNPKQQAPLANSGHLHKQPEGNKERFSTEGCRFPENHAPLFTARMCTGQSAKDAKLNSSPEKHAKGISRERKENRKKRRSSSSSSSGCLSLSSTSSSNSSFSKTTSTSSEDTRRPKTRKYEEKYYKIKISKNKRKEEFH